ncbi:hypothetical protein L3073_02250 [Ancylomarina sp. DW003]|nr:hypothetical protein [Ancylomarina sp. DW003]MDE5421024.1 hypothetical protein [Ancylomarina sp. DW003]
MDQDLEKNESEAKISCPKCRIEGIGVPTDVLRSILKGELLEHVNQDSRYLLCLNANCEISYFPTSNTRMFTTSDLKRPIWFKARANPQIACYCNNITYKQVQEAVSVRKLTTWKDIVGSYRKKIIYKCNKLNPTGLCCTENFQDVVHKAKLKSKANS